MDEDGADTIVHRVDDSILVRESQGEEPSKVADQPFAATWVRSHLFPEDDFEFLLQSRRELLNVFDGLFREADGMRRHDFSPKTSSNETVSPLRICSTDFFRLCRKPGVESSSMVSSMLS